jgi:hypothetical protein
MTWRENTHDVGHRPSEGPGRLNQIFERIPCGPILSMKELAEDQSLRKTGTVVEVDHPTRGKYLTVGVNRRPTWTPSHLGSKCFARRGNCPFFEDLIGVQS